jgi:hypothetical protein
MIYHDQAPQFRLTLRDRMFGSRPMAVTLPPQPEPSDTGLIAQQDALFRTADRVIGVMFKTGAYIALSAGIIVVLRVLAQGVGL